jgi:hypothetical protein
MTYRIDRDENGEEALIMTAIVRNNTVDLDWVHPGDDVEGFAQRYLVRSRALMGPSHSLSSQNAVFTLRLYRRGDVAVSGMACEDGFRAFFLCLVLAGCTGQERPAPQAIPVEAKADNQPRLKKLLSSTDRLIVKHFFPTSSVVDPKKGEFVTAGFCEFGPVIVFEPQKESERLKGVRIEVHSTYVRENAYSKPEKSVSSPVPTIRKRLGHCSLDVTLAYLRGREAEDEQEQNFANQSALAVYA